MPSKAAEARRAAREHPFLLDALRAGVVNYTAAAAFLGLDGEDEAVATALRRFAEDLPARDTESRDARVRMRRGVGLADEVDDADGDGNADDPVLVVGDRAVVPGGSMTAVTADGDVDDDALAAVLGRLRSRSVVVDAAGVANGTLAVVVPEPDGATALRAVETALDAVPT